MVERAITGPVNNPGRPAGILQVVSTTDSALATGTTIMNTDDSIPQNNEGNEYMTLAITPKNAANTLVIEATMQLSSNATSNDLMAALFQDATAGALAAVGDVMAAAIRLHTVDLRHVMLAGTVSATTFKIRAGTNVAGTTTFNGEAGARRYGGVAASSMVIREYAA